MIKDFYRPETIAEALELHRKGAVYLAGGTQLNSRRNVHERGGIFAPDYMTGQRDPGPDISVIYLEDLQLKGISRSGGNFAIGSCTTLQELIDHHRLPEALRKAAGFIPTRSLRNMATLGGNLAARRPDSYVIPSLIVLGAQVRCAEAGLLSVEDYLANPPDDLIEEILIPEEASGVCQAIKESRSHLAFPVVSAAVRLVGTREKLEEVVIAAGCGCTGSYAGRLKKTERAFLAGKPGNREELEKSIAEEINPPHDVLGSTAYKKQVNAARIAETLLACLEVLS